VHATFFTSVIMIASFHDFLYFMAVARAFSFPQHEKVSLPLQLELAEFALATCAFMPFCGILVKSNSAVQIKNERSTSQSACSLCFLVSFFVST
jgi:hypothetical protein